jgi:spermidine synthase
MNGFTRRILFFLFFISGFCSLVYQIVWTRLAFASFGIITPVLSVVLSVFMLGLAIGSWAGGRCISSLVKKSGVSAIYFYAGAELLIGLGAFLVPKLFVIGEHILLMSGQTDSFRYLSLSALVLAVSILPWCICMGATFPLMMAYVRELDPENERSFSFLYVANVCGAMTGTFLTAVVFIENFGFHHTLWEAAAGNFTVAFVAFCLGKEKRFTIAPPKMEKLLVAAGQASPQIQNGRMTKIILFATGFAAMAMEVVWTRAFTPVLKTQVYSFALIVFTYLGATFLGSVIYRAHLRKNCVASLAKIIAWLAAAALLPVIADDSRLVWQIYWLASPDPLSVLIVLGSICPFCALLGYLTPRLIEEYAGGQPAVAGKVYAINVLGCILGPLFACYILLPNLSERYSLILLALPFFLFWIFFFKSQTRGQRFLFGAALCGTLVWSACFTQDYETMLLKTMKHTTVRRDYAASVIFFGEGWDRNLLVNGIGMTSLTPITKFMVHLPLAMHQGKPQSALVICFGMGTTYRSALSWNIKTTVVELIPSVPKDLGFFHADAAKVLANPNGQIIIDDGRRFLARTHEKFDVIVVDPPPPVFATGSSLLFSTGFYALAKQHLNAGGILQMWFPGGDVPTTQAVLRSIHESFPYVRAYPSIEGWGIHLLASMQPITYLNSAQLVARMPASAQKDLLEWHDSTNAPAYLTGVITNEYSIPASLNPDLNVQVTDDQPYNEYFLLRYLTQ